MSESLTPPPPANTSMVRALLGEPNTMVNTLMPDRQKSFKDRVWPEPSANFELAANIFGGPSGMAMVPPVVARGLNTPRSLPRTPEFEAAVRNTKGASVSDDGMLTLPVTRNQHPDQAGADSVRGGVFYLPQGSKDAKYYSGTGHNFAYGGSQRIAGETAVSNPLFVKGATGGKAPEVAFDQLLGKGSYQAMRGDALHYGTGGPREIRQEAVEKFLQTYAPEMVPMASQIVANSRKGNQLPYALQEAAVASAARNAGHDSVIGYSVGRKDKQPRISELFDVRENVYPSPSGEFGIWPQFEGSK